MTDISEDFFAKPRIARQDLDDGGCVLRSTVALEPYPDTLFQDLEHWAAAAPDRIFLAERNGAGGWNALDYATARRKARAIAAALLGRDLASHRPVMILSDNSLDSALLQLGALLQVGAVEMKTARMAAMWTERTCVLLKSTAAFEISIRHRSIVKVQALGQTDATIARATEGHRDLTSPIFACSVGVGVWLKT